MSRELVTCGHRTLLFYGELYNDLEGKSPAEYVFNFFFNGTSESLHQLNGPCTAFAWDDKAEELTILTDRLGRFPVFWGYSGDIMFATTDLDALFHAGLIRPDLSEEGIVDLLTIGFRLGNESIFKGVNRLTGGQMMRVSRSGVTRQTYWEHRCKNAGSALDLMVDTFEFCVRRALRQSENPAITLSGGWDSRATCAVLARSGSLPHAVTYGVEESTDLVLAQRVAREIRLPHHAVSPERDFFESFPDWARRVVALSNGSATIDLAFQIYAYNRLGSRFDAVIDSAGCEFRRGLRARLALRNAKRPEDIAAYLMRMYNTGVWNATMMKGDFFREYASRTSGKLIEFLEASSPGKFDQQIDNFSTDELWAHHYAHGYPLQTSIIACRMPFSDNEFYDLFLRSPHHVRWSHAFHKAVIRRCLPSLERIPISYGSCKVPYGDSFVRLLPVLYHHTIAHLSNVKPLSWADTFDNYRPFRPYHIWYSRELEEYVSDTLSSLVKMNYFNDHEVHSLLRRQKSQRVDLSHTISILLTLFHLSDYAKVLQNANLQGDGTVSFIRQESLL